MPELPEVETLVRQLRARLTGHTILSAALRHDNVLDGVTARQLLRALPGRSIQDVSRRAKHALLHTDTKTLAVQPGMTGSLLVYDRPMSDEEDHYAVLVCPLDDGATLVYRDVRRIGTLRWCSAAEWTAYASRLGPEPLDPAFTADLFADRVAKSRAAIKKVIMDQRVVVGVGNIYAAEALFSAGIDPSKAANGVPRHQLLALHREIVRILDAAITAEGTTFRDYVSSTGEPGNFQLELMVYGREGELCRRCGTRLVATHEIDARGTVLCWRCQN